MLKVNVNRQDVKGVVREQQDFGDSNYIAKNNGLFAFRLPQVVKYSGVIEHLSFTFWDIELHELLLQLYLI